MPGLVCLLQPFTQLVYLFITPDEYERADHTLERSEDEEQKVLLPRLKAFYLSIYYSHEHGLAFASFYMPALEEIAFFWSGPTFYLLLSLVRICNLWTLRTSRTLFHGGELIDCHRLSTLLKSRNSYIE
ncbi:hypothetical protein CPB83DRAFT_392459 [Crepidotus variabilis]|uniref:Uncharacterized protein n=1 Tax=Crepidotus variabilis TaxID=179855 RepID=A0A9P6EEI1_9AGAR|nr:hypothetical protein CPB83DRAFT_392459 [Crepidotus variabilis]